MYKMSYYRFGEVKARYVPQTLAVRRHGDAGPFARRQKAPNLLHRSTSFSFLSPSWNSPGGYDRARGVEIGHKDISFTHMEEAFTSVGLSSVFTWEAKDVDSAFC
jgi:hypothetical protein